METAATPDDKKATKERPQDDFSISLVERLKFVRKEAHRHKDDIAAFALKQKHLTSLEKLFESGMGKGVVEEKVVAAEAVTDLQAPKRGKKAGRTFPPLDDDGVPVHAPLDDASPVAPEVDLPRPRKERLTVVNYSPEVSKEAKKEVDATEVTITFSEPMIPSDCETPTNFPASISPPVSGSWRWVDVQTLQFQVRDGFPKSTTYNVTVHSGTESLNKSKMKRKFEFSFQTPTPRILATYPLVSLGDEEAQSHAFNQLQRFMPLSTFPTLFLHFDQLVNVKQVFQNLEVAVEDTDSKLPVEVEEDSFEVLLGDKFDETWAAYSMIKEADKSKPTIKRPKSSKQKAKKPKKGKKAKGKYRKDKKKEKTEKPKQKKSRWSSSSEDSSGEESSTEDSSSEDSSSDSGDGYDTNYDGWKAPSFVEKNTFREVNASIEAGKGVVVGIRAKRELPENATIFFELKSNSQVSAEGPNPLRSPQKFKFSTCKALQLISVGHQEFSPEINSFWSYHTLTFNHPLSELVTSELVRFEPQKLPINVSVVGNSIRLTTKPGTVAPPAFQIIINGSLCDAYGKKLGKDLPVKIASNSLLLESPFEGLCVMDPAISSVYTFTTSFSSVIVTISQVVPKQFEAMKAPSKSFFSLFETLPGSIVYKEVMDTRRDDYAATEFKVNVAEYLQHPKQRLGQIIVRVEPTEKAWQESGAYNSYSERNQSLAQTDWIDDDIAFLPNVGIVPKPQPSSLAHVLFTKPSYKPNEKVFVKTWFRRLEYNEEGLPKLVLPGSGCKIEWKAQDSKGNTLAEGETTTNADSACDMDFILPDSVNLGEATIAITGTQHVIGSNPLYGMDISRKFSVREYRPPTFILTNEITSGRSYLITPASEEGVKASATFSATYYNSPEYLSNTRVNWKIITAPTNFTPPSWPTFSFGNSLTRKYDWESRDCPPNFKPVEATFVGYTNTIGQHSIDINVRGQMATPIQVKTHACVVDLDEQEFTPTSEFIVHPSELCVGLRVEREFVRAETPEIIEMIVTDLKGKTVPDVQIVVEIVNVNGEGKEQVVLVEKVMSKTQPVSYYFSNCQLYGKFFVRSYVQDSAGRFNRSEVCLWVLGGDNMATSSADCDSIIIIPDKKEYQAGNKAKLTIQSPWYPCYGVITTVSHDIPKKFVKSFVMKTSTILLELTVRAQYAPNVMFEVVLLGLKPRMRKEPRVIVNGPAIGRGLVNINVSSLPRLLNVSIIPKKEEVHPGERTRAKISVTNMDAVAVPHAEITFFVVEDKVLTNSEYQLQSPMSTFYQTRDSHPEWNLTLYDKVKMLSPTDDKTSIGEATEGSSDVSEDTDEKVMTTTPAPTTTMTTTAPTPSTLTIPTTSTMDFAPTMLWCASAYTEKNGRINIDFNAPEGLAQYRLMCVALTQDHFCGTGEAQLNVKKQLDIETISPKFLNLGDESECSVLVTNKENSYVEVNVWISAKNAYLGRVKGWKFLLSGKQKKEVSFWFSGIKPGNTDIVVYVATQDSRFKDKLSLSIPIKSPRLWEPFSIYGVASGTSIVTQPIKVPNQSFHDNAGYHPEQQKLMKFQIQMSLGGFSVSLSTTALQSLADAMNHLWLYPYNSTEAVASKVLAFFSLKSVLEVFQAPGLPSSKKILETVSDDLLSLAWRQQEDGGFTMFSNKDRNVQKNPFLTLHVGHAFVICRKTGIAIPTKMDEKLQNYFNKNINDMEDLDSWTSGCCWQRGSKYFLYAYSLFVRFHLGNASVQVKAMDLLRHIMGTRAGKEVSLETIALLLSVVNSTSDEVKEKAIKFVLSNVDEEKKEAFVLDTYRDDDAHRVLFHSVYRSTGIVLSTLIDVVPSSPLIPKLAVGLTKMRGSHGHWGSTQANCFALVALAKYYKHYESNDPQYSAHVWVNRTFVGTAVFQGHSTAGKEFFIPFKQTRAARNKSEVPKKEAILIDKQGQGVMYYRLGIEYKSNSNEKLFEGVDKGIQITRTYEAYHSNPDEEGRLKTHEEVKQNEDGSFFVKTGSCVAVKLKFTTTHTRYHVALDEKLPACFEPLYPLSFSKVLAPKAERDRKRKSKEGKEKAKENEDQKDKEKKGESEQVEAEKHETGPTTKDKKDEDKKEDKQSDVAVETVQLVKALITEAEEEKKEEPEAWFDFESLKEDNLTVFAALLPPGTYTYIYIARATKKGKFMSFPAKIGALYRPETYGLSKAILTYVGESKEEVEKKRISQDGEDVEEDQEDEESAEGWMEAMKERVKKEREEKEEKEKAENEQKNEGDDEKADKKRRKRERKERRAKREERKKRKEPATPETAEIEGETSKEAEEEKKDDETKEDKKEEKDRKDSEEEKSDSSSFASSSD